MYVKVSSEPLEEITELYFKKVEDFRWRIGDIDSRVLERYKSLLEAKGFLGHLCFSFYPDRAMKYHETSRELEKRRKNLITKMVGILKKMV